MEKLKDIKDIVEVEDYSFFLLLALIITLLMALSLAFYLFKNRRRRRKKVTPKEQSLECLKSIDYHNPKEVAYTFEEKVQPFLEERNQEEFDSISQELEVYKYKKEIPDLDETIAKRIKAFIGDLKC